jgi:hypothetical protein
MDDWYVCPNGRRRNQGYLDAATVTSDYEKAEGLMARLLSVNVGLPREVQWQGKTVRTAIWKSPVEGRRMARGAGKSRACQ